MSTKKSMDLIYVNFYEIREVLLKAFPNAEVEDASDYIHRNRTGIRLEIESIEEYHLKLAELGLVTLSLSFGLSDNAYITSFAEKLANIKKEKEKCIREQNLGLDENLIGNVAETGSSS